MTALALAACGTERRPSPVLLVAVDGLEPRVLVPLLRTGRLPNLARLARAGVIGTLETMEPTRSPVVWTTIATGKGPDDHGIHDFVRPAEDAPRRERLCTSRDRRVKAFWNVLTDAGVRCDVIGWWLTYPTEPIAGCMVAQTNTLARDRRLRKGRLEPAVEGQVWPPSEEPAVRTVLERCESEVDAAVREQFGGALGDLALLEDPRWQESRWSFRADRVYAEIARARLRERDPARVVAVYLGGPDVVGHRFWAAYDPEPFGLAPDAPEVRRFQGVIPAYYGWVDRVLGELERELPDDATVIVVSDHGMSAVDPPVVDATGVTGDHDAAEPGAVVAAGTGIRRDPAPLADPGKLPSLGTVADVCPTLLALVGVPFGEDMLGRPARAILDPTWLAHHPPGSVATHDDAAWLGSRGRPLEVDDPTRLRQLEALGYLDEDE